MNKFRALLKNNETGFVVLDLVMMVVLTINLFLILFDLSFSIALVQTFWEWVSPTFYDIYFGYIHQNFLLVDLWFVGIYAIEFIVNWIWSVRKKQIQIWYLYPVFHWYDLLGMIPIGGFRFLRFLRIISIFIRLQRLKLVDFRKTALWNQVGKLYDIISEEISDRVVVNIITGIQQEVETGTPVTDRIIKEVLLPRKSILVNYISARIQTVSDKNYPEYQEELKSYVELRIQEAVEGNKELNRFDYLPMVGPVIKSTIENAISDIVFNVINGVIQDLASMRNRMMVEELTTLLLDTAIVADESEEQIDALVGKLVSESLEVVKDQVKIKQWKDEQALSKSLRLEE